MSDPDADAGMTVRAARLQDLTRLTAFLDAACAGVDADAYADLRLASEEVFVNIVRHGYRAGPGPVEIRVSRGPDRITVLIADQAPRFDPASIPAPGLDAGWADREVGGLGWHLVRRVMDEVGWAPGAERGNAYRLVRHVGKSETRFQTHIEQETRT
ncbi:ATP-binding protein [Luteimonas sp. A482]